MRTRAVIGALALAASLTGCGGGAEPAPDAVVRSLDRVEALLEAGRSQEATAALGDLVRRTIAVRDAGELSEERAARILAAATELAAVLPGPTPTRAPSPTPTRVAEDEEKGDDEEGGKGKGRGKGKDDD
jgi:Flp pilus assembly protein TadD